MGLRFSDNIVALNAVTSTVANTSAAPIACSERQYKSIQFTCANRTAGNGAFGVEVSNDGTNWIVYNRLINMGAVADQHSAAMTAAPTLSSNTSQIFFFPDTDYFRYMRVFVTVTTDGAYTAVLQQAG